MSDSAIPVPRIRRSPTTRLMILLVAAHLPLLLVYYVRLWELEHYQFFPIALGTFGWWFAKRRGEWFEGGWLRTAAVRGLIVADVCLLVFAWAVTFYWGDPSYWAAAAGFILLVSAACLAIRDAGYSRSMLYLAFLPALTLRLPLQLDKEVILWLQRATTAAASDILNQLGVLHAREGMQLELPDKTLLVAEACSGVQSLFTIIFLAAIVMCANRRSIIQGLLLLAFGLPISGIMNVVRILVIALSWEYWQFDLASGLVHELVGYACLFGAALFLLSLDSLLSFVLGRIPDISRPGVVSRFWNPLIGFWNRVVNVSPRSSGTTAPSQRPVVASEKAVSGATVREYPMWGDLIWPANWFHFLFGLVENWIFSRDKRLLAAGIPILLLSMTVVVAGWRILHASDEPITRSLEAQFDAASLAKDVKRQELCLKSLSRLRRDEARYAFRLAQFQLANGRAAQGLAGMLSLASRKSVDSAESRKWLVRQAMSAQPMKPLDVEELESHLTWLITNVPRDADGHELIAQLYLNRGDWKLAEEQLTAAAELRPELNLTLAVLKRQLNRDDKDVTARIGAATEVFLKKLAENPEDVASRVSLSEALLHAGRNVEARETLVSGLNRVESPELKRALSMLDIRLAERELVSSLLNRDVAAIRTRQALTIDPANVAGVQMLARLHALGAAVQSTDIEPCIAHWTGVVEREPDSDEARALLGQLRMMTGDNQVAAELLRPLVVRQPQLRVVLARLLLKLDRNDAEARVLLEAVATESRQQLASVPDDVANAAILADALLLLEQPEEVHSILSAFAKDPAIEAIPSQAELATRYGRASLMMYDRLTGLTSFWDDPNTAVPEPKDTGAEAASLLSLLDDALQVPVTSGMAIDRLAQLSLSDHSAASEAQRAIRQLRLEGQYGAMALNMIGMHALLQKRYSFARENLERALAVSTKEDAMILNNLAIAIVREGNGNLDKALEFASRAGELLNDHPDVSSTRGEIHLAMQRYSEALADVTQSVRNNRDTAENHRLLERIYQGLNEPDMASEHRTKAERLEAGSK